MQEQFAFFTRLKGPRSSAVCCPQAGVQELFAAWCVEFGKDPSDDVGLANFGANLRTIVAINSNMGAPFWAAANEFSGMSVEDFTAKFTGALTPLDGTDEGGSDSDGGHEGGGDEGGSGGGDGVGDVEAGAGAGGVVGRGGSNRAIGKDRATSVAGVAWRHAARRLSSVLPSAVPPPPQDRPDPKSGGMRLVPQPPVNRRPTADQSPAMGATAAAAPAADTSRAALTPIHAAQPATCAT
eukprot:138626-Chlamydomonas_euryale.AAC.11